MGPAMMSESLARPKPQVLRVSSGVTELSAQAQNGLCVASLEKKIRAAGLTILAVCQRARVTSQHFYMARAGTRRASRWYIRRCELALEALMGGDPPDAEPSDVHIRSLFAGFLSEACRFYRIEMDVARRALQGDGVKARHLALYLVNTELAIRPATLARLFGVTRAAMTMALRAVEDRREDPAFDSAVSAIAARITGRT